jgi:ABC-type sugar transport system permease subunit
MRSQFDFGEASAMAWIYYAVVIAAIGIVTALINRSIYYENE